jgi:Acyclic terpene utilisation family protein AtuA
MRTVRIGAGSAYWGDLLEPAVELAERGACDYLGFDHLAELTLAILQRQRAKDPTSGYIADIVPWTQALLPITRPRGTRIVTNAGGANPPAAAGRVIEIAQAHGLGGTRVGVVTGDDILGRLRELQAQGVRFPNLDTGEEDLGRVAERIVAANAYIGAEGIVEALAGGAHVVVVGRCSDSAVFVGPLMHEFGWTYGPQHTRQVAAAVTIGHLLECAALANGAVSNFWREAREAWRIGYPIAEVGEDATAEVTKLPGSGGVLSSWTVKEQLVYEVHDPRRYLTPDGVADFTLPRISDAGPERVRVEGMGGAPRPDTLKVCIGYADGWIGEGQALFSWPDAYAKARRGEEIVRERLKMTDVHPSELLFEYVGVNTLHGPTAPPPADDLNEVGLRVAAHCASRQEADAIRRELTHLWTLGGVGSAIAVPSRPRPVVALWPTLIPRDAVDVRVEVLEA